MSDEYEEWMIRDVEFTIVCRTCLIIDIKVADPHANVQCLFHGDD